MCTSFAPNRISESGTRPLSSVSSVMRFCNYIMCLSITLSNHIFSTICLHFSRLSVGTMRIGFQAICLHAIVRVRTFEHHVLALKSFVCFEIKHSHL